jgi:NAD(P)H-dependent flavin oxidoreductase YrpB (nitropropane dioxygenase family)
VRKRAPKTTSRCAGKFFVLRRNDTNSPAFLSKQIAQLKSHLVDKNAPFGVDLLLPQVGGNARKTNSDYTSGKLPELIDIIIESGAKLFVCAVGVAPRWAVDKLHKAGIAYMNMIGAPKHVEKALAAGADIICAQGGEGGGHTGDVATSILIPAVVDLCRGRVSELTNGPVHVVAAGGIFDGRGLAMALAYGASAVWVGTRFVCASEAGAPPRHQRAILDAGFHDTVRTVIFTGRPMRVLKNPYIMNWEESRQQEIQELIASGVIPYTVDVNEKEKDGDDKEEGGLPKAPSGEQGQVKKNTLRRVADVSVP